MWIKQNNSSFIHLWNLIADCLSDISSWKKTLSLKINRITYHLNTSICWTSQPLCTLVVQMVNLGFDSWWQEWIYCINHQTITWLHKQSIKSNFPATLRYFQTSTFYMLISSHMLVFDLSIQDTAAILYHRILKFSYVNTNVSPLREQ